jgi:dTDP-4-dehydrorhamnose reductase
MQELLLLLKQYDVTPVFVEDIAKVIKSSINEKTSGVFHLGTKKFFNRYELGLFLAKALNYDAHLIKPTSMNDIDFSESRPNNNMLEAALIERTLNFKFCEIEEVISELKILD